MLKKEHALPVYVGVSLLAIGVLTYLVISNDNQSCSPYVNGTGGLYRTAGSKNPQKRVCATKCLCAGSGKICADSCKLTDSYLEGNTEYQNFAAIQKGAGGPFWKSTNFNKY